MLILSRKAGERIQIGDCVTITVVRVHGRRVRIGIQAPAVVEVRRRLPVAREIAPANQPSADACAPAQPRNVE